MDVSQETMDTRCQQKFTHCILYVCLGHVTRVIHDNVYFLPPRPGDLPKEEPPPSPPILLKANQIQYEFHFIKRSLPYQNAFSP